MNYVILIKSHVKQFVRTRKGKLERVKEFERIGNRKYQVDEVTNKKQQKQWAKVWEKLAYPYYDREMRALGLLSSDMDVQSDKLLISRVGDKPVAYIAYQDIEDKSGGKPVKGIYVSFIESHAKGEGKRLIDILKKKPGINFISMDAQTHEGAKLWKKMGGKLVDKEGAYGLGTWDIRKPGLVFDREKK